MPLTEADFALYQSLYQCPSIQALIGICLPPAAILKAFNQTLRKVSQQWQNAMHWVIFDQQQTALGITALVGQDSVEVGTLLLPSAQNCGVAKEVMGCTIDYAFREFNKTKVFAYFWHQHIASLRLVQSLNFYVDQQTLHQSRPLPSWYCEKINKNRVSV